MQKKAVPQNEPLFCLQKILKYKDFPPIFSTLVKRVLISQLRSISALFL